MDTGRYDRAIRSNKVSVGRLNVKVISLLFLSLVFFGLCFAGRVDAAELRVYIEPKAARDAGAQWRIWQRTWSWWGLKGGWRDHGSRYTVRNRKYYKIEFKDVGPSCTTPSTIFGKGKDLKPSQTGLSVTLRDRRF